MLRGRWRLLHQLTPTPAGAHQLAPMPSTLLPPVRKTPKLSQPASTHRQGNFARRAIQDRRNQHRGDDVHHLETQLLEGLWPRHLPEDSPGVAGLAIALNLSRSSASSPHVPFVCSVVPAVHAPPNRPNTWRRTSGSMGRRAPKHESHGREVAIPRSCRHAFIGKLNLHAPSQWTRAVSATRSQTRWSCTVHRSGSGSMPDPSHKHAPLADHSARRVRRELDHPVFVQ